MIVRELFASLGIQFDQRSAAAADQRINSLKHNLRAAANNAVGTTGALRQTTRGLTGVGQQAKAAAAGMMGAATSAKGLFQALAAGFIVERVAAFGTAAINAASDADEAMNVINEVFEGSKQQVLDWAAVTAGEVGRSEYKLRAMAGTLGAVLSPMMEGNAQAAADMSTGLSKLAVDLASFFNTTDDDALVALKAGIVGESEPMRRFGVVMLDSTLQAFALSQGINKSMKSMTIAEKTALRYRFILDQTQKAQGDAARTSEGFANASRAAKDMLYDLSVTIGKQLLPYASKALKWLRGTVPAMKAMVEKSEIVKGVLVALGIAAAVAFAPALIATASFLLTFAAISLVVDDLIVMFKGGKSVIAKFLDKMFGAGTAAAAVKTLSEAWREVDSALNGVQGVLSVVVALWAAWQTTKVVVWFAETTQGLVSLTKKLWLYVAARIEANKAEKAGIAPATGKAMQKVKDVAQKAAAPIAAVASRAAPLLASGAVVGTAAALAGLGIAAYGAYEMNEQENAERARLGDEEFERQRRARGRAGLQQLQGRYSGAARAFGRSPASSPTTPSQAPSVPRVTPPVATSSVSNRSNSVTQQVNAPITVNGAGNPQDTARAIREQLGATMRDAKAQLSQEVDG